MAGLQREIDKAVEAVRAGDFGRADRILQAVLRKHPRDADALHLRGVVELKRARYPRAVVLIERAIQVDPGPYFFHNNHGEALRGAGRYDEALEAFEEALVRKPDYPEAFNGRGNTLRDLGRMAEASIAYTSALSLRPEWPPVLTNLGALARTEGDSESALSLFERAEQSAGPTAELHHRIGATLFEARRREEATIRLARAVDAERDSVIYRRALAAALDGQRFGEVDPWFVGFLTEALADPEIDPASIVVPALSLLEGMAEFEPALDGDGDLPGDVPLLRALLSAMVVPDVRIQRLVTRLRLQILEAPADADPRLAGAVAMQCYDTDYAAECPEQAQVDALWAQVEGTAELDAEALEPSVLALAAYGRLNTLANAEALAALEGWSPIAVPVLDATLWGPLEDARIAEDVPVMTEIDDAVSQAVRAHYEVHPYPRWRRCAVYPRGRLEEQTAARPGFVPHEAWPDHPRVLVAGCGTGQQPVNLARAFPEVSVLAVDLSRTSLAYAVRQAFHAGVSDRIDFAQADLLRLGEMEDRFEQVESVGVLHHMADPLAGWRVLRGLVRPGGVMRIGLYSEKARALVVAAREVIAEHGFEPTVADIRRFRRMVIEDSAFEHLTALTRYRDFHDLSMCRDLLFHAHERRFDIPTIAAHLETLDLRFLGFEFRDARTRDSFNEETGAEWTDLDAWDAYEAEHPDTFWGMYNFYCQLR